MEEIRPDTALEQFPGVGPARAKALAKLGLRTAGDLLEYYPRSYEDRTRVSTIREAPGDSPVCIRAMVSEPVRVSRVRDGLELVKVRAADDTGTVDVTFFNQRYLKDTLHTGEEIILFGTAEGYGARRRMTSPVWERADRQADTGCILPVYPLTAGITNHLLAGLVRRAVDSCADTVAETLPESVRLAHRLETARFACRAIHFPDSFEALEAARRRLVFEELFYLTAGLEMLRRGRGQGTAPVLRGGGADEFQKLLPFPLTAAQRRVMGEVQTDLASGRPMNRLIQGDVGSGKTAVAGYAAWLCAKAGWQTAMMVPTELLAEQHYRSLCALLAGDGVRLALLTGSLTAAEKRKMHQAVASHEYDVVIGTQALLSEGVSFHQLGLVIADEQHRFGVEQRARLAGKAGDGSRCAHVLVMSATPIPRTLALIVYGELEVSVIDELPPGRLPVQTYLIGEDKRERMYQFVRKQVQEGHQVYIVCPAVEDTAGTAGGGEAGRDRKAVTRYAAQLQSQVFPDLRVAFVHGKMKPKEKEAAMAAFARGETDVLVSTTVIEVGVDVPNASLIVIENAESFGLSQLHQLRGRVGRGKHQSFCVLLTGNRSPATLERLRVFKRTTDGFQIAEADLNLRGPGDFFGSRQHGLPRLRVADLARDIRVLQEAQSAARDLLAADPELAAPEHAPVLARVRSLFSDSPDIFN